MTDNYDQLALSWVRKEINNTLDQARQGLQRFAEDNQDRTQIQFCINCLHQVQGTLHMLKFAGAEKLVQEMEFLVTKMSSDESFLKESVFEVLMKALHQLPGYLERLEEGQSDITLILLPLINQVRAVSGLEPLEESDYFTANVANVVPPQATEQVSEEDKTSKFQENAKKLRAHFQKGLTGIIRGVDIKQSLARIHKVLLRLEALTAGKPVARLWWVADGFVLAIIDDRAYKKREVHQLLGQVDKQIKRLSDEGANAMSDIIEETLLSRLLYYVANSKSKKERIVALKKEFNLDDLLNASEEIKQRQSKLERPDVTAVSNVAEAINEELATVKDQLDLFVRAQAKDPSELQNLVDTLTRISDTLTLLELAIPRDVIRQQITNIQKHIDKKKMPSDALIMDIAGALLFVEANLKNIDLDKVEKVTEEVDSEALSKEHAKETQVSEATRELIKVARRSMQNAKDSIINYIASGFNVESIKETPTLLQGVLGAVKIAEFDSLIDILKIAKNFIEQRIIASGSVPEESHLDALADVITCIEYYLEASQDGMQKGMNSIIKGSVSSIATLEKALQEAQQQPIIDKPKESTDEKVQPQISEQKFEVSPILSAAADKQVDQTLIDQEVLEIFLEEIEEESEVINEMLPRWKNDENDEEALTTLRRSFHTLKGSGRLVGAQVISELAWAVENMLNKVIEGSISADSSVRNILNEVHMMLPSLVKAFANQEQVTANYQELVAKAEHISAGKQLADFNFDDYAKIPTLSTEEAISEQQIAEQQIEEAVAETSAQIDPLLLEIFTNEAETHIQVISDYLAKAPKEGKVSVTDELIRALHTLKGSANMAGVEAFARLTGPWEKFSRLVKGGNHRFSRSQVELLEETRDCLNQGLEKLREKGSFASSEISQLTAKLSQLGSDAQASGSALPGKQRDQRLVSIFLTEGSDILHEVIKLNDRLESGKHNVDIKQAIHSELNTFHRGAKMLAIDELEQLAESAEKLSLFAVDHETLPSDFNLLMIETIDSLTGVLNKIASEEDIQSPKEIVEKIDQWISSSQVESAPEDMDIELVELFVEEGEELIVAARDLFQRWRDNLSSKEINAELRRIYHTLKGSSRMAGAMGIGELAYAVEEIFNGVIDHGRELSVIDYQVTLLATDKLSNMIAKLKSLAWPEAAEKEVEIIKQLLSKESIDEDQLVKMLALSDDVAETVEQQDSEQQSLEEEAVEQLEVANQTTEVVEATVEQGDAIEAVESAIEETVEEEIVSQSEDITEEKITQEETKEEKITSETQPEPQSVDQVEQQAPMISTDVEPQQADMDKELLEKIEASKKQSSKEVVVEDTITPAEPVIVAGDVHKIELDEDGEEVLDIYLEEADELLMALDEGLHDWSESLENKDAIDLLQRTLHTFKGGARLSDLTVLGDLTHEMESYFEHVNNGSLQAKKQDVEFLLQGYDVIENLVNEVKHQRQMTVPSEYMQALDALIKGKSYKKTSTKKQSAAKKQAAAEKQAAQQPAAKAGAFEDKPSQADAAQASSKTTDVVRVASDRLESLVNLAGETSIFRSRLEQQISVLRYNLEEMNTTVERLRDQLRNLDIETEAQITYRKEVSSATEYEDFDPLEMDRYTRQQELTRSLGESAVDLMSLKDALDSLASDSETLLLQQGRVNTEMQESLMRTRMTPFESLVPRLRRMVRQISTELGKTIELSINADGEMDRTVLEKLIAPIEHMLRNAMDHGIEPPEERKKANKNPAGSVKISLYREGSEVFVKIQDDGRGLNLQAIRKKAIEKGLINKSSDLSDHELQQLILEAGFSTAQKVTQISGRGVGMDVVSSEIKQMGGVIEIDSIEGQGATFTVKLPFSVSVNQALMVQIGEDVYAIPLANIEGIVRVSPYELEDYYSNQESAFEYAGVNYSIFYLGQLLDHSRQANLQGINQSLPVLLLHGADHPTAMQVDELLGSREIVVKSIGGQLSSISGLSGATILGDGRVVLILDMPALIRRIDATVEQEQIAEFTDDEERASRVMVVDDSITVRKVTSRLLERHDFEVITAKDGVDALSVLNEQHPDVMLLDIEMPRMDGFELATIIRHDDKLKDLPIIMITSRTGQKHRERAEQIGVNLYMGKPYNEVDLIEAISSLLPTRV